MKGNLLKRSIYLLLVLTLLTIPSAGATSIEDYTDVPDDYWGREGLAYCVEHGYMQGVGDNKMNPDGQLSLGEFVTMLSRVFLSQERRDSLDQTLVDLGETLDHDDHWASKYFYYANQTNITFGVSTDFENWDKPVTRADMAVMIDNLMNMQGQAVPDTRYVYTLIPDWDSIEDMPQSRAILRSYKDGILVGVDGQGTFSPNGVVSRATAATLVQRIQDPTKRATVNIDIPDTNPDLSAPQTIHEGQGSTGRLPQAGDTYISSDGTSIVLKIDPTTNVLGYNQGYMDYWTGSPDYDGSPLQLGNDVDYLQDGVNMGGMLIKGDQGVYTREQWYSIRSNTRPSTPGTYQDEKSSDGLWQWAEELDTWIWKGPLF